MFDTDISGPEERCLKWVIQEIFDIAWNADLEIMDSCQKYWDIHKTLDLFFGQQDFIDNA